MIWFFDQLLDIDGGLVVDRAEEQVFRDSHVEVVLFVIEMARPGVLFRAP